MNVQREWKKWRAGALGLFALFTMSMLIAQNPVRISGQDSSNDLAVAVGKSVLIDVAQPIQTVAIGDKSIAEVTATSPKEVMVNGKSAGQTSLILWSSNGDRRFFTVTVRHNRFDTDDRIEGVQRELTRELPGEPIQIRSENGSIFLSGTVKTLEDSDRAVQIATTGLAVQDKNISSKPKVVNLLYVQVPAAEKQILLKVRFASLDRSKARKLGISLVSLGLGNTVGGISTGQFSTTTISSGSSSSSSSSSGMSSGSASATFSGDSTALIYFPGLKAGADIEALDTKGVTQVLAEPNLIATNGKQASFLAGGEYPVPVVQGGGSGSTSITIQWKEYGVRLNFIPLITARGTIRLQVAPEVSALDTANEVEVDGYEVPALTVRRVQTEAELADGESLVIGGLLDNRETEVMESIPYLSSLPVLGKFFQSKSKSRTNTELIVSVTPEIVKPTPAGKKSPELNFPVKFLDQNTKTALHQPDEPAVTSEHPETVPVEKLVDSLKQEKELKLTNNTASKSSSSNSESSSSGMSSSGSSNQPQ